MSLTAMAIQNNRPKSHSTKISDGGGLYILVEPTGAKYWRLAYRFGGKQKVLALGVYPAVSLAEARKRRETARELLARGVDPAAERKQEKRLAAFTAQNTFEAIAREWWDAKRGGWSERHASAVNNRLERELFPNLGNRPIAEIEAPELLDVIRAVEKRGALELASKTLIISGQVFRYAIVSGRAKRDPSRDLRGALETREARHYNALKESELPEFLAKLDIYDGSVITKHAIRLLMLTFVRTGELRAATWTELNLDKAEWRIPGERMKMGEEHIVPLSTQALEVLEKLHKITGDRDHLFPNEHHPKKCMSENTILFALYRMGYRGRATGHGFRATASTTLNEQGWHADAIERQLAHSEKNKVRAAYHRSEYLPERRKMMQAWADYLDGLQSGATVVQLRVRQVA